MPENFKKLKVELDTAFAELKAASDPTARRALLRTLKQLIANAENLIQEFVAGLDSADHK